MQTISTETPYISADPAHLSNRKATIAAAYRAVATYLRSSSNGSAFADNLRQVAVRAGLNPASFPGFLRGTRLRRMAQTIKHLEPQARGRQVHRYAVSKAFKVRFEQITGEAY